MKTALYGHQPEPPFFYGSQVRVRVESNAELLYAKAILGLAP
jgi:hypothetical protein